MIPIRSAFKIAFTKISAACENELVKKSKLDLELPFPSPWREEPLLSRMVKKYLPSYSHLPRLRTRKKSLHGDFDLKTRFSHFLHPAPLFFRPVSRSLPWTLDSDLISSPPFYGYIGSSLPPQMEQYRIWNLPPQVTYYACISLVVVLFCVFLAPPPHPFSLVPPCYPLASTIIPLLRLSISFSCDSD